VERTRKRRQLRGAGVLVATDPPPKSGEEAHPQGKREGKTPTSHATLGKTLGFWQNPEEKKGTNRRSSQQGEEGCSMEN